MADLTRKYLDDHPDLKLLVSGKVREVYEVKSEPQHLLFVATDRVSAFDVILTNGIFQKGPPYIPLGRIQRSSCALLTARI